MKLREEIQAVIYQAKNNKVEFLIVKRWDGAKNGWLYRLIKGGIEENESHKQALIREVLEEIGLRNLIPGPEVDHYRFTSNGGITHDVHAYLVGYKNGSRQKLQNDDEEKIKEIIWCEESQAIKLLQFKEEKECLNKASEILRLTQKYLGQNVKIYIDRPFSSRHPKHGFIYEANYGYVPDTKAPDGEELDAYYLGVDKPVKRAEGKCIAIIHRLNDNDDKLVIVPDRAEKMTNQEIDKAVHFQEKWFEYEIIRELKKLAKENKR